MAQNKKFSIKITCRVGKEGKEPIYGAAYSLTDRAYARISGNPKTSLSVTLTPKAGTGKELKKLFEREWATQKLRWTIARNNQTLREYIVERAIRGGVDAPAPPAPSAVPDLTEAERREIEKLIADVEAEIKERNKGGSQDPLGISATWEEKHGPNAKKN